MSFLGVARGRYFGPYNDASSGGGGNAKPNRNRGGNGTNKSSGSIDGGVGGDKAWKCQCVTDTTTKPVVFCGKAVSSTVKDNMIMNDFVKPSKKEKK
jgi:hypothetical protein